ncbi:MAG: DegQ family serine endoprotease [Verrucomicrobiales bacterium]|nr:DegQ family serine endoprotease [Verrucomicrobiales bacterium]
MKFTFIPIICLTAVTVCAQAVPTVEQPRGIVLDTNKPSFSRVIKKVAPSIVNVYSSKTVDADPQLEAIMNNPMLRDLFGDELHNSPKGRTHQEQALGSGVIVSRDGYILTNFHVVDGADDIEVSLAGSDKEFTAKVVGTDPPTDLAVLKIVTKDLPVAELGDSDGLQVGDVALAVGNPFGVGQTVTMGIVSATGRGGFGVVDFEDFIQTDASINPGNSGGALADGEGRVVGINTAILSAAKGGQGIGFAVPINLAKTVMQQIINDGRVARGSLGVVVQPITPELAKHFKLNEEVGALIGEVVPGGAASVAGMKAGDIITEFQGKRIDDPRHLRLLVGQLKPGTLATVAYLRHAKEQRVVTKLDEMAQPKAAKVAHRTKVEQPTDVLDGVTVTDMDSSIRNHLKVPRVVEGAMVLRVTDESPAYAAGLRPGDVMQEINHEQVQTSQQAVDVSRKLRGQELLLRIWSDGGSRFMTVNREAKKLHAPVTPLRD